MISSTVTTHIVFKSLVYFFLYSFLGWLMETVLCSVRQKKFVNRGFLAGPVCPIYGTCMTLLILFLTPLTSYPVLLFFVGGICASALEYFTSWSMEKLFHAKWWDYQDKKFNLHGRICLQISIAWGILIVIFLKWIHPTLFSYIAKIPHYILIPAVFTFCFLFIIDLVQSIVVALQLSKSFKLLEKIDNIKYELETLSLLNRDSHQRKLREFKERLESKKFNFLQKRLIRAYPHLKSTHGTKLLQIIDKTIKKSKADRKQNGKH